MAIPSNADPKRSQATQVQPQQRRGRTTMSIEAMKQALEALEIEYRMYEATDPETGAPYNMIQAITSLRQAIAEAEKQEPVAWISWNRVSGESKLNYHKVASQHDATLWSHFPLYTHPQPKREWVGLNWDDLPEIYVGDTAFLHGAKWAEAKLKEKNT